MKAERPLLRYSKYIRQGAQKRQLRKWKPGAALPQHPSRSKQTCFFDNHVGRIHLGLKIGLFANIVHGSFQTLYGLDASIKPSYSGRNQKRFFEKTKKEEQSKPKEKKEKDTEGSKRKQSEGESKKPKSNKNKRRRTSK